MRHDTWRGTSSDYTRTLRAASDISQHGSMELHLVLVLLVAVLHGALDVEGAGARSPDELPECKGGEPNFSEYWKKLISNRTTTQRFKNGVPSQHMESLDALHVAKITVPGAGGKGLLTLNDCSVTGAAGAEVLETFTNLKNSTVGYTYKLRALNCKCRSYHMDAKFLDIGREVKGNSFQLIWPGYSSKIVFRAKLVQKCNATYLKFFDCLATFLSPGTYQAIFDDKLSTVESLKAVVALRVLLEKALPKQECIQQKKIFESIYGPAHVNR